MCYSDAHEWPASLFSVMNFVSNIWWKRSINSFHFFSPFFRPLWIDSLYGSNNSNLPSIYDDSYTRLGRSSVTTTNDFQREPSIPSAATITRLIETNGETKRSEKEFSLINEFPAERNSTDRASSDVQFDQSSKNKSMRRIQSDGTFLISRKNSEETRSFSSVDEKLLGKKSKSMNEQMTIEKNENKSSVKKFFRKKKRENFFSTKIFRKSKSTSRRSTIGRRSSKSLRMFSPTKKIETRRKQTKMTLWNRFYPNFRIFLQKQTKKTIIRPPHGFDGQRRTKSVSIVDEHRAEEISPSTNLRTRRRQTNRRI